MIKHYAILLFIQHAPIQYEISYSLNETEDLTILYFGMKHAVKFQLPAGYENNSHRGRLSCN